MADAVKLDNRVVAGAVRAAKFAARMNRPVTSCPYRGDEPDTSALRRVWLSAYLRERPPAKGSVSYKGDGGKVAAASKDDDDEDDAERVQAEYEAALAALLAGWPLLAAPLVDDLVAQAQAAGTAGLAGLTASAGAVDQITTALADAMATLAGRAADQVAATAQAQGVDVPPVQPDQHRLAEIAAVTAALIASGYASAAARRALLAPTDAVADAVRAALDDMTAAQKGMVADNLGAALSTAQGQGRAAVFAARPPRRLIADEANDDSNRCANCRAINGTVYASLEAALADYPVSGYRACEGLGRCRGHLRAEW